MLVKHLKCNQLSFLENKRKNGNHDWQMLVRIFTSLI
jgi:hypothetical protein